MRRILDLVVSSLALCALAPLFVVIALAIKLESRGTVFFRGPRSGRGGKPFRMWKFRTMVPGAASGGPITGKNDSRITGLGRFLRKSKLDELPQFINVWTGEMTLVGPRPESPELVELYDDKQKAVLAVKPGVTGTVQLSVDEESETLPPGVDPKTYYIECMMSRKILLDLEYLQRRTAFSDAWIVFRTAGRLMRTVTGV